MTNEEDWEAGRRRKNKWIHGTNVLIYKNGWQTPEYKQDKLQKMKRDKVYMFHRADMWYPIELHDDADAIKNAECNPGTTKVENWKGEIVWELKSEDHEQ